MATVVVPTIPKILANPEWERPEPHKPADDKAPHGYWWSRYMGEFIVRGSEYANTVMPIEVGFKLGQQEEKRLERLRRIEKFLERQAAAETSQRGEP